MSLEVNSRYRQSHSLKPERQEYREKLFNPEDNEAVSPKKYGHKIKKNIREFKKQASKLEFYPLGSRENYPGNYDNYLQMTLSHIAQMKCLRFDHALEDKQIFKGVPDYTNGQNNGKKILLLDLDETLIHADFNGEKNPFYGKKHTEEAKKRISEFRCTKVECDGIIFNSIKECAEYANVNPSSLRKYLRGLQKTLRGTNKNFKLIGA